MVPSDWSIGSLGDLADTVMGYAFKSTDFTPNGIPLLRMGNLYQNTLDFERSPVFLPTTYKDEYKRFVVKPGDLVMSMTGTMGKRDYGFTVQIPNSAPESLLNQRVMKFVPKDKTSPGFLLNLLRSEIILSRLYSFPGGTKQANLSATQVLDLPAPIPPYQEQNKIAQILSTWDKAIFTTEQLLANSQQQKNALMQQLLTGKKRLLDKNGVRFSGEWCERLLGDISKITTGSSNRQDSHLNGEYTFFDRSEDIRTSDSYLFDCEAVIVPGEGQDFVPKYFKGKFDLHQRTYAIMDFPQCDGRFLFYAIHFFRSHFLSHAVGSTVKSLRLPMFQKMKLNLPSFEEQQKIATVLSLGDEEITALRHKLDALIQEKKALMQQLLTGKRRVKLN